VVNGEQSILLEKRDRIAYITFNRPEKLNAIRWEDYALLDDMINECDKDDDVRVVIVTGKGRAFSAGDDMDGYPGSGNEEAMKGEPGIALMMEGKFLEAKLSDYQISLQKTCMTILNSAKVFIAAVNGLCWVPEIVYPMDFVIAADVATFSQADASIGLSPGGGGTQLLPRLLGRRHAIEFLLMSEEISAEEAYRIGLVSRVVPAGELIQEAEALAKKMIARPASSIKLVKMAVTRAQDLPLKDGLELEEWYCSIATQSESFRSFYQKFLARKQAKGK